MKNNKAFTVAELLIATTFLGIILSLTLPGMDKGMVIQKRKTAYNVVFNSLKESAAEAQVSDGEEDSAQRLWKILDKNLPVIGYAKGGKTLSTATSGEDVRIYKKATWKSGDNYITTLGDLTAQEETKNDNNYSPWIVLENGIALTVNGHSDTKKSTVYANSCGTNSNMYSTDLNTKLGSCNSNARCKAQIVACLDVVVDVNGLDKGPNIMYDTPVTKAEALELIKNVDRYTVYVVLDGVSAGPVEQNVSNKNAEKAFLEHWLHK